MRKEYDFSQGVRGAVLPTAGKTRVTIMLDDDVIEAFRARAETTGQGYQTLINAALRAGDSEQVQRWSAFTKLLCDALDKLPSVSCTVFRGLDQPLTQISHLYVKG